jgi:hypothetical protein
MKAARNCEWDAVRRAGASGSEASGMAAVKAASAYGNLKALEFIEQHSPVPQVAALARESIDAKLAFMRNDPGC